MRIGARLAIGELFVEGEIVDVSRGGVQFLCTLSLGVGEVGRLERPRSLSVGRVRVARANRRPDGRVALGLSFDDEGPFLALAGIGGHGSQ